MLKVPLAEIAWGEPVPTVSIKPSVSMSVPVVTMLKSIVPVVGGAVESPPPHAETMEARSSDAIPGLYKRLIGGWMCMVGGCE